MNGLTRSFASIFIALFLIGKSAKAQTGFPKMLNYSPKSYANDSYVTSPQNWGIVQDDFGRLYVGNTNGVLIYDGVHWQMVEGTQDLRLFKFARGINGVIYSGGINEMGFFSADSLGQIYFESLVDQLPDSLKDFERILSVVTTKESVFFRSSKYLINWDGETFQSWRSDSRFRHVFSGTNGVYVHQASGLYALHGNNLSRLFEDSVINSLKVYGLLELEGGTSFQPNLLLVTRKQGLFIVKEGLCEQIPSALDSMMVFNCCRTSYGDLAVGTNGHGLLVVNKEGTVQAVYNEKSHLQQNQVVWPYLDQQNGLWTALFSGISRISHDSKLSSFEKEHGLGSIAYSMHEINGKLTVGTLGGFYTIESDQHGLNEVNKGKGISSTVLDFVTIGGRTYLITGAGVYAIDEGETPNNIFEMDGITCILISKEQENTAVMVQGDGYLHRIELNDNGWKDLGQIAQLNHQVYSMQEDDSGNIWAGYDGLSLIQFTEDGSLSSISAFDSLLGFTPEMGIVEISKIEGRVFFGTEIGIYEFDSVLSKLVPSNRFGEAFSDGSYMAYNLTETRNGDVWVTTGSHTGILLKQPNGSFKYDSLPLVTTNVSDVWSIYEDSYQRVWVGGTEALVCYDPSVKSEYDQPFHTLIHEVKLGQDSLIFKGFYVDQEEMVFDQPSSYQHTIPFKFNDISFSFAAPFFEGLDQIEFSYKLEGQDEDWSSWEKTYSKEYTNLGGGEYVFTVRAKNAFQAIGETAKYRFTILPPWYLTYWAFLFYALIVAVILWITVKVSTYRLKRAKIELELIVDDRTSEIRNNMSLLEQQKAEIESEREKSDSLLLNILPKETAAELKEKGAADTKHFESASVLFTDFKNFTRMSEILTPAELVQEINICFSAFDEIVDRFGLEKIKTIGDAYMCAGGLPVQNTTHAKDAIGAALEMQRFIDERKTEKLSTGQLHFDMRCGVHTGPVVAGVVGVKKFQYDIWGDTVNLASRMESSGEIGKVNISDSTYELVKGEYQCTFRGEIEAKNKGNVKMYFVEKALN